MTGPAVDLAAVRTARTALAAIVAEHPELTGATARARLAANLPEIIAMPPRLDPDSADSTIVGVRMTPEMRDALDAEVSRQRALNPDVSIGRSNVLRGIVRRALLGSIVTPSTSAPAAPAAPAPMRPIVSRVEAVEPPAAAPAIALHNAANGASVATPTGNDNAQEPSTPKPKRTRRAAPVDAPELVDVESAHRRAAEVAERLRALRDAEAASGVRGPRQWTIRPIAERAGMSGDPVAKLMRGEHISPAMVDKLAAILPAE